jgi:hypothetical protein
MVSSSFKQMRKREANKLQLVAKHSTARCSG